MDPHLPGIIHATRAAEQAGEAGARMHRAEADAAAARGLIRAERRCGCCLAIYKLTKRGREWLARLAADEAAG